MGILVTILLMVMTFKILGFVLKIVGKILGSILGIVFFLAIGGFVVNVIGMALIVFPIVVIVGIIGTIICTATMAV